MYENSYVFEWRINNYERHLLQGRVDSTKHNIKKCLGSNYDIDKKAHKLKKLYKNLFKHEETLEAWKAENPTYFSTNRKTK